MYITCVHIFEIFVRFFNTKFFFHHIIDTWRYLNIKKCMVNNNVDLRFKRFINRNFWEKIREKYAHYWYRVHNKQLILKIWTHLFWLFLFFRLSFQERFLVYNLGRIGQIFSMRKFWLIELKIFVYSFEL